MSKPAPVYFLTYNSHPVACYTQAWRTIVCMRCMFMEGLNDLSLWKVVRYRLAKDSDIVVERSNVTDSFLRSLEQYGISA